MYFFKTTLNWFLYVKILKTLPIFLVSIQEQFILKCQGYNGIRTKVSRVIEFWLGGPISKIFGQTSTYFLKIKFLKIGVKKNAFIVKWSRNWYYKMKKNVGFWHFLESTIFADFEDLTLGLVTKYNNFLVVCWFLGNLFYFLDSSKLKLYNPTDIN